MTMLRASSIVVLMCGCLLVCAPARTGASQQPAGSAGTDALVEFNRRVQAYASMHRMLERPAAAKPSTDPEARRAASDALAMRVTLTRLDARQGEFFTVEISALFRQLIRKGCGGSYAELLALVGSETVEATTLPRVNERWAPLTTRGAMSPNVLCELPALPPELEYRFRGRHLVLRDVEADLVVDVLPNAVRETTVP